MSPSADERRAKLAAAPASDAAASPDLSVGSAEAVSMSAEGATSFGKDADQPMFDAPLMEALRATGGLRRRQKGPKK